MSPKSDSATSILAGGAVVHRERPGRSPEILLVHRDRYSDWSLPKGKVEPGESVLAATAREVREETGVTVRLGAPLDTVTYPVGVGVTKEVRYWYGEPLRQRKRPPDNEIDEVAWLPVQAALRRLSYSHDRLLVEQSLVAPDTATLMLVRHGAALERKDWSKADKLRPLSGRGRRQAKELVPFLSAYAIKNLVSSTAARCTTTLKPYARKAKLSIDTYEELTEESCVADPEAVIRLIQKIREEVAATRVPTAVCIHRPVLPTILDALDLAPVILATGEMLVTHLSGDDVHAIERHLTKS